MSNLAEFLPKASFQEKGLWSAFNLNLPVLYSLLRSLNLKMCEGGTVYLGTTMEREEDNVSTLNPPPHTLVSFHLGGHNELCILPKCLQKH